MKTSISVSSGQEKTMIPGPVLAVIMVIIVEMMFFGGLISAYILARTSQVEWPPADQPRLPVAITFTNLLVLLLSGFFMYRFQKNFTSGAARKFLYAAMTTGFIFFMVQGFEWMRLLLFGIKAPHSLFTSFFYTLIGLHGLHVLAGLILLIYLGKYLNKPASQEQKKAVADAVSYFWYFVVLLWPVLYYLTYWV